MKAEGLKTTDEEDIETPDTLRRTVKAELERIENVGAEPRVIIRENHLETQVAELQALPFPTFSHLSTPFQT
ncbi:MAG: hypothetical protein ACETWE_05715 [Candidatus Bathyarchaeia archaeon]